MHSIVRPILDLNLILDQLDRIMTESVPSLIDNEADLLGVVQL